MGGESVSSPAQTTNQTTATNTTTNTTTNITSDSNNYAGPSYSVVDSNDTGLTGMDLSAVTSAFSAQVASVSNALEQISNNTTTVESSFLAAQQASASAPSASSTNQLAQPETFKQAIILTGLALVAYFVLKE